MKLKDCEIGTIVQLESAAALVVDGDLHFCELLQPQRMPYANGTIKVLRRFFAMPPDTEVEVILSCWDVLVMATENKDVHNG